MKISFTIISATFLLLSMTAFAAPQMGTMTDPRDGKKYKTVTIGGKTWMAENMATNTDGSVCFDGGKKKKTDCKTYGRYYSRREAIGLCPEGWHLPTMEEFDTLLSTAGGAINLKSKKGWNSYPQPSGNGKDRYGFGAKPSGACFSSGACIDYGNYSYFWTSTGWIQDDGRKFLYYAFLGAPHADFGFDKAPMVEYDDGFYMSVRCVENEMDCSKSLDLSVHFYDESMVVGIRAGFQPNIYFKEMWTFRCKSDGQRVTYSAKEALDSLKQGHSLKCQNGTEISPEKYMNELEKVEFWTIEKNSEADSGRVIWAVYSSKSGKVPDQVYMDENNSFLAATSVDEEGNPPSWLEKPAAGTMLATIGRPARKLTVSEANRTVLYPLLAEDYLINQLVQVHEAFKDLKDVNKINILFNDEQRDDMKWVKKKYGSIMNKIKKVGFNEIYFLNEFERKDFKGSIYRLIPIIKFDDEYANRLYKTLGVKKPTGSDFAKESKRCHYGFLTADVTKEEAEEMSKALPSKDINEVLKEVARQHSGNNSENNFSPPKKKDQEY